MLGGGLGTERLPKLGAYPVGLGRAQPVDGDDTLDHVGEHGHPRPAPEAHRDDAPAFVPAQRAVDPDEPGWAPVTGCHQAQPASLVGEDSGGFGEQDGRGLHAPSMMTPGCYTPRPTIGGVELNPAQQSVIALLGKDAARAALPDNLAEALREELEAALTEIATDIPEGQLLVVSKHPLKTIHQCEAHHLAGDGDFEWSPATAAGVVAHRAIELMVSWRGQPVPGDLVDETLARIADDDRAPVSRYLQGITEYDRADLRNRAVNRVTQFQDCFPPIKSTWLPRAESRTYLDHPSGRVRLVSKSDLTLGRPGERVIIDLKTGYPADSHREDLRFYALLETLTLGVAPRKTASYYLDAAKAHAEDVGEGVLRSALRRTVDAVERMVAVRFGGDEPHRSPGAHCMWCPLAKECEPGLAHLQQRAEADGW